MRPLAIFGLALAVPSSAFCQTLAGTWSGRFDFDETKLNWSADPAERKAQKEWVAKCEKITYRITLNKDGNYTAALVNVPSPHKPLSYKGTWTQAGREVRLRTYAAHRPQWRYEVLHYDLESNVIRMALPPAARIPFVKDIILKRVKQ
jgi:hypothetical protein